MRASAVRVLVPCLIALGAPAVTAPTRLQEKLFSEPEASAVVAYWSSPERYASVTLGEKTGQGRWHPRYTSAGSIWVREFYRLRAEGKVVPTRTPEAQNEQQRRWDAWLERRVALDRWLAEREAALRNAYESKTQAGPAASRPQEPGEFPDDLAAAMPPPPPFYAPAIPLAHTVTFEDDRIEYTDHVSVPHLYAYFRFETGVRSGGTQVPGRGPDYLDRLCATAGVDEKERRVFTAVSILEGGFDSVNTYDTGYVSVGFIQFASLSGGAGSLGQVLLRLKQSHPEAHDRHFRKYGIDVTSQGVLAVLDPTIGVEFYGPMANQRIIHDKRLIAVFQRAGRKCDEFNAAQIAVAKAMYYPAGDTVQVQSGGRTLTAKVGDIFKSEAGLATLMDRKVNTGSLEPLADYLADLLRQTGITDLKDASKYEWALVRAMAYRKDYLALSALSQPAKADITLSRGSNPRDRRGGG